VALTQYAQEVGADAALVIAPYYNKPTPQGQFLHFQAVAQAAPQLPIMLYNVPSRVGIKMSVATITRLRQAVPNIVAIKEACGSVDQVTEILEQSDMEVLSGDDALTLPLMAVGASGVVSVVANLIPAAVQQMCVAAAANDFGAARKIHFQYIELMRALFIETNPMGVKTALALLGKIKFALRLPLCAMEPANEAKLKDALCRAKLL
jgi:4-hydroxy-tetrahydrodipicolinate synthase